jgi:hypothetical protein
MWAVLAPSPCARTAHLKWTVPGQNFPKHLAHLTGERGKRDDQLLVGRLTSDRADPRGAIQSIRSSVASSRSGGSGHERDDEEQEHAAG